MTLNQHICQLLAHYLRRGKTAGSEGHLQENIAGQQLRQDAAQRPDIDFLVVRQAQDDLWGAVGSRLHIAAQVVAGEAGAAQVDHLDLAPAVALYENVLWLQVCRKQQKSEPCEAVSVCL